MSTKVLRLRDVIDKTGIARSTIYLKMGAAEFPKPIPLGTRSVGWIEEEVELWLQKKIAARTKAEPRR